MIEEFDHRHLDRRETFLINRAAAHLSAETDYRWHKAAGATLLRDAAAVAFIRGDILRGCDQLRRSGDLFLELGLAGGFQHLYIAGAFDEDTEAVHRFSYAFLRRAELAGARPTSHEAELGFHEESFQTGQLLRAYQALAATPAHDDKWLALLSAIRTKLMMNAAMPVGTARVALATYLATYDQLAGRFQFEAEVVPGGTKEVLRSLAQRRDENLTAARRDQFHWKALLRPAELIDFDLLALMLAGIRQGQSASLIRDAFRGRDAVAALPQVLAGALRTGR